MASTLLQLSELISSSVAELIKVCTENKFDLPDLDKPFSATSEAFRANAAACRASGTIIAAATQLASTLKSPQETMSEFANQHAKSAALQVCLNCNVAEILREAGSDGVPAREIAIKSGVDDRKLARLLRYLCNDHVFREVRPNVFMNNRRSSILDTGKPSKELFENPSGKHDNTRGSAAMLEFNLNDGIKTASCLYENMTDPLTAFSDEPNHAPVARAFNFDTSIYEWFESPGQEYRRHRFGIGMKGVGDMETLPILYEFDWKALPPGSVVCDVGGGVGAASMRIAKVAPDVRVVIQDLPAVVAQGKEMWKRDFPEAINSGRIKFQAHNFLTPQPVTDATIFLLKSVLHNWSDQYNIKILSHLRTAATAKTKLLVVDSLISYTCDSSEASEVEFESQADRIAPKPLLPTFGAANAGMFAMDMAMMSWCNTQAHTLDDLKRLFSASGWRMQKVYWNEPMVTLLSMVLAVPAKD
ncbi:S-adenosyl-L-methionine-dependent methyltransferase [Mycena floridula]|nr:S-adenosyl-L-methionine-dependent methyltransferase [Mycena floridula]